MFQRLPRIAFSFIAVLGVYGLYALLAVPLIEPQVKPVLRDTVAATEGEHERSRQRYRDQLADLFPSDAWELGDPKVVETDQGLFLFQDYKTAANGRLEVQPCTVVMYSSSSKRARGKPAGRPILMFVPGGAELQFDGESDTTRAEFGRLQGGVLRGDIRIVSPASQPGAQDEISIQTRDIQISEQKVWTPHRVDFRFGKSVGSGQDLMIALAPSNHHRGSSDFVPAIGGVKSLELAHIDKMQLQLGRSEPDSALLDATPGTRVSRTIFQGPGDAPLEIMCQGAFHFDFVEQVASFEDHVDVVRIVTTGVSDQLNCERLLVYFALLRGSDRTLFASDAPRNGDVTTPPSQAGDDSVVQSIARIVAMGRPVMLRAPSIGATAQAEFLEYNLQTRRIVLRMEDDGVKTAEPQAANLQYGHFAIVAPYVEYEMPADPQRLGRAWAAGPGQVTGQLGGDHPQPFLATWGQELHIRPHEDQHVISLTSDATIRFGESDHFAADELHIWLHEVPCDEEPAAAPDVARADRADAAVPVAVPRSMLIPDRVLAQGNVRADSPQLAARAKRLEAWFRAASGDAPAPLPGERVGSQIAQPKQPGNFRDSTARDAPPQHKIEVTGDVIRLQMLLIERRPEVDELAVEGQIRLVEVSTSSAAPAIDQPLTITGDSLQAQDISSGHAAVAVSGHPALVAARGMSISGGSVQLRQAENKLWIDGPGQMLLPPPERPPSIGQRLYENSQLAASRQQAPPITVSWQDRMIFDGSTVQFHGRIQLRGKQQLESGDTLNLLTMGERLDATLTQRLDFNTPLPGLALAARDGHAANTPRVDVRQLMFVGSVYLENQTFRDGAQVAFDRLWIDNLSLDQNTGRLHGDSPRDSPGECRRVQLEEGSLAVAGANGSTRLAKPPRLMSLFVTFHGGVEGNLRSHQVEFQDQVMAWFSPVQDWTDETPPPAPQDIGDDSVLLTCDRLAVVEMGGYTAGQRPVELAATGNVSVTGQRFKARGGRLSYARAKDLLVLDGDSRGAAELWQLPAREGKKPDAIAGHIEYWPQTGAWNISHVKSIENIRPRSPLDRTAKPPQQSPR